MARIGREKQAAAERLPWKPSSMELECESGYDGESLGWEEAPSSRWPVVAPASLERESNRPTSLKKVFIMKAIARKLAGEI